MPRKSAIYNIVDVFISELQLRFIPDFYGILPLEGLIPSKKAIHNGNDIIHAALKYNWYFRSSEFQLKSELKILGAKSDNMDKLHQKWDENNMNEAIEKAITMEMIIREASERYSVPKRTIRDKVKDFAEGEKVEIKPCLGKVKIFPTTFNDEHGMMLYNHIKNLDSHLMPLSKEEFLKLVYQYAEKLKIKHGFNKTKQKVGKDFYYDFMKRHCGVPRRRHIPTRPTDQTPQLAS
ncbi:hypothetical protein AVEN_49872-1 [Araneus ventricosus]|uniref:HTH psq-type domain-containing protein n=1 Tax=Araneus ventricosus TaxID=182803 RepID=A0A4Y2P6B9_ARAVE|nr:hypothetical protein AVEN_213728-1 [Araneus ventricosus]GBN46014.1 hypothetical protein AVEN_49872-1 [Araneus ventricosus]